MGEAEACRQFDDSSSAKPEDIVEELGKLGACPWTLQKEKSYWKAKVSGPSNGISTGRAGAPSIGWRWNSTFQPKFIDSCVFLD